MLFPLISILLIFTRFVSVLSQIGCRANEYFVPNTNFCAIICPTRYYSSSYNGVPACLPQRPIEAVVRPTVEERVFILSFNDTSAPFIDAADFEQRVRVTLSSPTQVLDSVNISAVFLTESKTMVQILVNTPVIDTEAIFQIQFPNFQIRNYSEVYIVGPATFSSLPYSQLSNRDEDVVKALTILDRGLEYAWITVTCLNPYAFLYMNTKFYRETLEMFKKINVQYGPIATKFFRQNNNKVSGFKAPNMFPIILTDNDVTSGWNRREENSLPFNDLNIDRVQDLEIVAIDTIYEYESYPLFLDNYGIQITVFIAILILIAAFEFSNILLRKKDHITKSKVYQVFQAIRTFLRWNLLLASIIGSYQSLIFYIMVQIQAFASESHIGNNKLNFWFAIGALIILGLGFPIWLIYKMASVYQEQRDGKSSYRFHKEFYGIFFMFSKLHQPKSLSFVFALMIRSIIFAIMTALLSDHPVAQVAAILAISVVFVIYLIILRPYSRDIYNIYQLGNEMTLIAVLSTLMYLAHQTDEDFISDSEGKTAGFFLIAFWLFIPTLGIIFGLAGIAMRFTGYSTQIDFKPSMPIINASRQRQEEIVAKKVSEDREIYQGKGNFLSSNNENEKHVRSPNAIAIKINSEDISRNQRKPNRAREYTTGASRYRASTKAIDRISEEGEKEQESDESRQGTLGNKGDLWNSSQSYKSQIKSLVYMSSFEKPKAFYGPREIDLDDIDLSPRSNTNQRKSRPVSVEKDKRIKSRANLDVDQELVNALFDKQVPMNLTKRAKDREDANLERSNQSVNNRSAKNLHELKLRKRTRGRNPAVLQHIMNKSKYLESEGFKTNKERFASEDA